MAAVLTMIPHKITTTTTNINTNNVSITDNSNGAATELNSSSASAAAPSSSASATFHDFMGTSFVAGAGAGASDSPNGSASIGADSSGGGGGGRGCPISTISDLGSERQGGNHFEGVPYYGPRSDLSGAELSNRLAGSKRSNSDSTFVGSSRDGIPQIRPASNAHMMKLLREQSRRSNDEDHFFGLQALRPNSASLMLQPPTSNRPDGNVSKWDRRIPMNSNPVMQYSPRGVQFSPSMQQAPPNRFRDSNAGGPSVISQSAADEGSRTGIKGSGILSSINASSGVIERNPSVGLPTANRPSFGTHTLEPESNLSSSRHASRQMTIFYGGQAHVFDEVHPNKADVIMALAGSNGGSWSTTYSPKSDARPGGETHIRSGENETGPASNIAFLRELRGRSTLIGHSNSSFNSADRISSPTRNPLSGGNQGGIVGKDTSNAMQAAEPGTTDEKRKV